MTKSEKQWWKKQRAKGYLHFLSWRGVLQSGLAFGILMTLIKLFTSHDCFSPIPDFLIRFAIWVLGFGAVMGTAEWLHNEKDYQKPTEGDDTP